jgi:hypothetical protein
MKHQSEGILLKHNLERENNTNETSIRGNITKTQSREAKQHQ